MSTIVKKIEECITDKTKIHEDFAGYLLMNHDNMSYLAYNKVSKEAIIVDPVLEDIPEIEKLLDSLKEYKLIAVIDTHTHADHISGAANLSQKYNAPLIMHLNAPSARVDVRISKDTHLYTNSSPIYFLVSPGHTRDSITPIWGPFVFGGDTILFNDAGRDDLPTGNPNDHWHSLQKIKKFLENYSFKGSDGKVCNDLLLCTNHDGEGRISSWKTQLKDNPSLKQSLDEYLKDNGSYVGPSPKLLKESLYFNFK